MAWRGKAWRGVAWHGLVRQGQAWQGMARRGEAGRGTAGPGKAGQGMRGKAWHVRGKATTNHRGIPMTATIEPGALAGDVSNAGEAFTMLDAPYRVSVRITGDSPLLFHRWQSDSVAAKQRAAKNSAAKKTDDIESYVWRDTAGTICLPGEYLRGSLIDPKNGAAKYLADPRSPRKSALDLFRAGVLALTDLAPITRADGTTADTWDYLDRRRVTVQRAGITRERPAFAAGWAAGIILMVTTPQYIDPILLRQTLGQAGRLVGVGDFRPSFGRYTVTGFDLLED